MRRSVWGVIDLAEGAVAALGRSVAWLLLAMALIQFALVLMRYVFGTGAVWLQELVIWCHALVFLGAAGWTLGAGGHVRVDIFHAAMGPRARAGVELFGTLAFLWPMCWLIWDVGLPYVERSWAVREGSRETAGLPGVFLLKTMMLVFAASLALQGAAIAVRSLRVLAGRTGDGAADLPPER